MNKNQCTHGLRASAFAYANCAKASCYSKSEIRMRMAKINMMEGDRVGIVGRTVEVAIVEVVISQLVCYLSTIV